MLPLDFVPYAELGGTPNVIVDGSAAASTRLVLSHWPGSPTPSVVADDLSAQIAFRALDHPELFDGLDVVSNNHFDQDGLVSVFALVDPVAALARQVRLVDVARAGDFGTFADRDAARVAMALAAWSAPDRSPLGAAWFGATSDATGALYLELLPRLVDLVDRPEGARQLWEEEDARLERSIAAIAAGTVTIEERPDIDLAVITVDEKADLGATTRFTQTWSSAVHPMAVNNATERLRVLVAHGRRYHLELRYETWVMLSSRSVLPRPDLRPLAEQLTALERDGAVWTADPPGALTPMLGTGEDESSLDRNTLIDELARYLRAAPTAWDPSAPRKA